MVDFVLGYIYIVVIIVSLIFLYSIDFPKNVAMRQIEEFPKVSIIIPARNEENNIARCLESITNLDYPNYEVIMVDGNSEDSTIDIASNYEISIIEEPEKPEHWVGKPWGCYTGYKESSGDFLLFTDADTWHHPKSLETTVHYLQKSDGFLSFLTTQEFYGFWEHVLTIIFLIISVSVRGTSGTNNSRIANGQYMMFTRKRYEDLGTHEVVKSSIIEDLEFASKADKKGYPPLIITRRNLITARMYTNFKEIKEGFGKNLGLGVQFTGIESFLYATLITVFGMGWIVILTYYLIIGQFIVEVVILSAISYGLYVALLILLEKNLTTSASLYPILYPLYYLIFWYIILISMYDAFIKKEISWKNRQYTLN